MTHVVSRHSGLLPDSGRERLDCMALVLSERK